MLFALMDRSAELIADRGPEAHRQVQPISKRISPRRRHEGGTEGEVQSRMRRGVGPTVAITEASPHYGPRRTTLQQQIARYGAAEFTEALTAAEERR